MSNFKNCSGALYTGGGIGTVLSFNRLLSLAFTIALGVLAVSCGSNEERNSNFDQFPKTSTDMADSVAAGFPGLHTDTINGITHNFVRTADLKMRVKNVLATTNKIEDLALNYGGYISKSELYAHSLNVRSVRTKKDSLLEINQYLTSSAVRLRVPAYVFDTVIKEITAMGLFVDLRRQEADDVKIKLYANALSEKRLNHFGNALEKKVSANHKLNQINEVEENILKKQMLADSKKIDSYTLADKVNYSTVVVELYQTPQIASFVVPASPEVAVYEPPFYEQVSQSFFSGLNILKKIILLIVNSWSLIVFGMVVYFVVMKLKTRFAQKS